MRLYSVCKNHNDDFFNALPFENSFYVISG